MSQQWNPQHVQSSGNETRQQQTFTPMVQTQVPMAQSQVPMAQPQAQVTPYFSAQNYQTPGFVQQQLGQTPGRLPLEQSFIENILRLNRGKVATFYMTFENNEEWNAKVFRGRIEEAGRDHIIISDLETGKHYLLLMVTLDYVEFDEPINYMAPFGSQQVQLTQYSPR